ncbi:MAG: HTH-type transcriptional regulator MlrA [Pseudomonas fluorescens]|nr:MAG: HTH-type transcriptional regulator MlrA [Pseudomonas fluorescens]
MSVMTASVRDESLAAATDSNQLFPIREVSRLTGVNPVTLRAWERRYGLIQPVRTESGHRLYSRTDIDTVHRILDWIERGVSVSKVGRILARDAEQAQTVRHEPSAGGQHELHQWQARLLHAISSFDDRQLERLYGQIFAAYPLTVVFQDILMPLWQELSRHQGSFGQASEWLFFDEFLRLQVLARLRVASAQSAPRVLLAAMPGECRRLELLVAGLLMGSDMLAVQILAVGQPFEELTLVCEKIRPQAMVVFSNHSPTPDFFGRLNRLALTLDCPLLLAGDAAELAQELPDGAPVDCLGNEGRLMQRRLQHFAGGRLAS